MFGIRTHREKTVSLYALIIVGFFAVASIQLTVQKYSDQTPFKVASSVSVQDGGQPVPGPCNPGHLAAFYELCRSVPVPTVASVVFVVLVFAAYFSITSFLHIATKVRQRLSEAQFSLHFLQAGSFAAWFLSLQKRDALFV